VRVLCCWTRLHPATAAWLTSWPPVLLEFADVSGGPMVYWKELAARWDRGDDLLIVEHDVSGPPGHLAGMAACTGDWCASPYDPLPVNAYGGLGCTRFSARLQASTDPALFRAPWRELADAVTARLVSAGWRVCPHPPVRHHHGDQRPVTIPPS
jgi:hypothetical protein